ncbi:hypothetical protein PKCEKB_PKCEKB_05990, partial [Dysosmobacter welbionis]
KCGTLWTDAGKYHRLGEHCDEGSVFMKIKEILDFLQTARIPFSFTGDPEREVDRFSSLSHYREGSFTWIKKQENIPLGMDLTGLALVFVA